MNHLKFIHLLEGLELVFRLVFKTSSRRIKPAVAGSIPAPSAGKELLVNGYLLIVFHFCFKIYRKLGVALASLKAGLLRPFFVFGFHR